MVKSGNFLALCLQFFFKLKCSIFFLPQFIHKEMYSRPDSVLHIQVFMGKQNVQICYMLRDCFRSIKRLVQVVEKPHSFDTPLSKSGVENFTSAKALCSTVTAMEELSVPLALSGQRGHRYFPQFYTYPALTQSRRVDCGKCTQT